MPRPGNGVWPSIVLTACVIQAGASGCARQDAAGAAGGGAAVVDDPMPAWTREGLEAQPQMGRLREQTPPDTGYMPGTTPWRPVPASVPGESDPAGPGELLSAVIVSRGWGRVLGDAAWEQTTRIWSEEDGRAEGIVLQWGFMDDAVAGRDFRVVMRLTDGAWRVERIEERYHCRRAVSATGLCA